MTSLTSYICRNRAGTGAISPTWDTTVGTYATYWRRIGDSMEIIFSMTDSSAGTSTAGSTGGSYFFSLPNGYTIDTSKMPVAAINGYGSLAGTSAIHDSACSIFPYDGSNFWLDCSGGTNVSGGSSESMNNPIVNYRFTVTVPITGWGT